DGIVGSRLDDPLERVAKVDRIGAATELRFERHQGTAPASPCADFNNAAVDLGTLLRKSPQLITFIEVDESGVADFGIRRQKFLVNIPGAIGSQWQNRVVCLLLIHTRKSQQIIAKPIQGA